jgi:amino acid adenylation domain-containing protein
MRGKSESAEENVRRPAGDFFQRDTLKVVNMIDLARELSGATEAPVPTEPQPDPAEFWKHRFEGWRAPTPLVSTIPSQQNAAARKPAVDSVTLDESASEKLRSFADRVGIPFGVLFQASWALLLHRYSGEDEVTFGVVKGCFERDATDAEPGVHIVPSRIACEPERRVRHWLRALADQAKLTAPFEFISLEHVRIVAGVPPAVPMFESVLSVGHDAFDPLSIASALPNADQSRAGADTYPLVAAAYLGREITLRIAWSPQRFSEAAIHLLAGHWSALLVHLSDCVEEQLDAVPMLTSAERTQLLCTWNETRSAWPSELCVHQIFEQQVTGTPDVAALQFAGETLSYRELNGRANVLANYLRARDVGPDAIVGISIERSFDMAIAVLAVLKAGAAYLPLDPSYPKERLQFMLQDSRATILLTQKKLQTLFPGVTTPVLCLDENWASGATLSSSNLRNLTAPENLSYLIYTSGSTGKPKGVAMIHRALVNLIDWQVRESRVGAKAKTLQFTSLSFDVSFQEMFSTWCAGGTLVLIPAELRLSPRELWDFIVREKIARIFLPFVALQQLADAAAARGTRAEALREVITAGEQLQITPRLRELFENHSRATLHNHYGPSESHVVTALTLTGEPKSWPALPSIGRPIQNTQIYLLDQHLEPVPIGLPGELYIGGVALARGYFERPEVTAQKFIHDPFSDDERERLYKTGDLARYLPDGEIEFLGRIDHQVKIRGYRVELGEIEAAINKQDGVGESAVIARELAPGQKQLVAYVVPCAGAELTPTRLRHELKRHLPEYMVPAVFVHLEKLPLTPSGKVDRKSLPPPEDTSISRLSDAPEKPWLPVHFQLVQIWEEILGVKPIGIRDNFFDLGGHSLLAVKMMDRVEEVIGKKLPVTALFNEPTIVYLADLILDEKQLTNAPVLELQRRGHRLPLYFLHGDIIGGGFYARDISRLLGDEQPFFVLPPLEIDNTTLPTVEEMAAQHLRDLRTHRARGPYLLGGFCVGALVAYEMACRLAAAGEEVPFVALIDPQLPSQLLRANHQLVEKWARWRGLGPRERTRLFARGHKVLYRLRELWNSPVREWARFATGKVKRIFHRPVTYAQGSAQESSEAVAGEQDILALFHWIISAYEPPTYGGSATMFLTDEQQAFTPFLESKWRKVAPQIEIHRIAGKHLGAITTDVHLLASKMNECLDRVNLSR